MDADAAQGAPTIDAAQQAAREAADQAVSRYEANEAAERASGRAGGNPPAGGDTPPTREQELAHLRDTDIDAFRRTKNAEGLTGPQEMLEIQRNKADEGNEADESGDIAQEVAKESAESSEAESDEADNGERADDVAASEDESPSPVPADLEERASWVPLEPGEYDLPQVENHRWTEGAKASWQSFAGVAHELDLPQGAVDKIGQWFVGRLAEIEAGFKQVDAEHNKSANKALKESWGDKYDENSEATKTFFKTQIPKELRQQLRSARLPDGRKLIHDPHFIGLIQRAAKGHATQQGPTVDQRLEDIDRVRRTDIAEYRRQRLDLEHATLMARKSGGDKAAGAAPVIADADERREVELAKVRDTDIERYRREKNGKGQTLMQEMLEIQRKRAERAGGTRKTA